MGRQWGCPQQTIYNVLRRAGIPTRDDRESHAHGKRCKPIKNLPPEGKQPPLCKCDCGGQVIWNQRKNGWNLFVVGHYRGDAPYKNPDWLRYQYVDCNRTLADIGAECGVNLTAIRNYMGKFGIEARGRSAAIAGRQAGEKNPAWKGGTTPERQRLYKAGHWREFSQAIYARDGFRCQRCGTTKSGKKKFHAHHIKSWADHPAERFNPDNCITVCNSCHLWIHSLANTAHELIAA